MPVIEARGVSHRYGERTVLSDVDVVITEQRVGIVGANGSGKSTFVRMLNGLVLPTAGTGHRGRPRHPLATGREVRRRVGFCFTDPDAQIVMPTVAEDVALRAAASGPVQGRGAGPGGERPWRRTVSPTTPTTPPTCCPAARSSCSRSPRCWSPSRRCW